MSRSSSASNETVRLGSFAFVNTSVLVDVVGEDRRQALFAVPAADRLLEQAREPALERLVPSDGSGELVEARRHDRDPHLVAQRVVDDGAEDDVGVGVRHAGDVRPRPRSPRAG